MAKEELIAAIAEDSKITKVAAEKAVNAFTATVKEALKKRDKIALTGFGTFSVVKRKARKGLAFMDQAF